MVLMCEETKDDKERAGVHETCVCGQASRDTRVLHHVSREFGRIGRSSTIHRHDPLERSPPRVPGGGDPRFLATLYNRFGTSFGPTTLRHDQDRSSESPTPCGDDTRDGRGTNTAVHGSPEARRNARPPLDSLGCPNFQKGES